MTYLIVKALYDLGDEDGRQANDGMYGQAKKHNFHMRRKSVT